MLIDAGADLQARSNDGTVLEAVAGQYRHNVRYAPERPVSDGMLRCQDIMAMLFAAGERNWPLIPTPCRGLHHTLPAVLKESTGQLGHLFRRLMPEIQGEIRVTLLLINHFTRGSGRGTQDLRLPLLEALVALVDS